MSAETVWTAIGVVAGILAVAVPFGWRWTTRINLTYNFSRKMATNHLPHIYDVQKRIAEHLGVEVPPDPPINFVEIGNGEKK